jgi:hypothetical protein
LQREQLLAALMSLVVLLFVGANWSAGPARLWLRRGAIAAFVLAAAIALVATAEWLIVTRR